MSETASAANDHKAVIRAEFTKQADAYAAAAVIKAEERLARLVAGVAPQPSDRAVEIATGPGYVAMALAERCAEVVGLDLTEAPLKIAERMRAERGLANVSFRHGDAEDLPFKDGEFDIAVCRFAFHHFERPEKVLAEMRRVCRRGGTIAVEDLYASELPERADYMNRIERLRDHSHTNALSLGGLIAMCARAGIEIIRVYSDEVTTDAEEWFASAQTAREDVAEVNRMLAEDMRRDVSGMLPFVRDGRLFFRQRTVALIGRRL
ncbi:MAG TPA: class I SAM-dependent methyltransferase [Candidatus Binataceae bacterium]|nr:class I SAM-dependent methyltransferase [Candidatus Binataceae bacterium]